MPLLGERECFPLCFFIPHGDGLQDERSNGSCVNPGQDQGAEGTGGRSWLWVTVRAEQTRHEGTELTVMEGMQADIQGLQREIRHWRGP